MRQKVFENKKVPYAWNFKSLNLTYFEVPKTGSSSTKTLLFQRNFELGDESSLELAKGKLKHRYSDAVLKNFDSDDLLSKVLVIYRNPILRAKSVYRHVFLGMHRLEGSISDYFAKYLEGFLATDPTDSLYNHHKPMTWFFPNHLIDDPRSVFVETENLSSLPALLGLDAQEKGKHTNMPHLLKTDSGSGKIDMTDDEIRIALGSHFDNDFELFEKLDYKNENCI